ncbi:uncharacterized protein LOC114166209 [Vigna unguiculata]|uniref:uncharacterized protein LOC114166209 n=1 Tax=Vigna unguiculata TaxID=3917 RepID=UPI001015CF2B|nr:uncharacterized protein LOC114166209 [Vigna unguiculata]
MSEKKPREITIKLLCPSLSKVAQVVAWEDQRIDLGSISRAFGLDPSTLRLNGYFISRGVDLIASSLTWNSLLSFFSSKGLSTGRDQCDALLVTGKLCKVGLKRGHDSLDFQDGIGKMIESENADNNKGIQLQAINLIKNKKLKESSSGEILKGQSCKRKQLWEDVNLFKKLKIDEDKSDIGDKIDDHSGSIARNQFTCSYSSKNMKRIREDEAIVAANYKRIR